MEHRPGEPENSYTDKEVAGRTLARNIIIRSIRDLGLGNLEEIQSVVHWKGADSFSLVCKKAEWDSEWILSILDAVQDLHKDHPDVRKKITRESVRMLKKIT